MAIKEWSTNYPTAVDTATEQPTLVNNADATRVSQIHAMRDVGFALQAAIGTTGLAPLTSLRARAKALETKLPRLAWSSVTLINIAAAPGEPSTVYTVLQDGKVRSFSGTITFNPSTGVADGGLDAGSEASSTWYYLYLVPSSGDDDVLAVRGSTADPDTGPSGYSEYQFIGAVRNDASSDILKFWQTDANEFTYSERQEPSDAAGFGTTAQTSADVSLIEFVPDTASEARMFAKLLRFCTMTYEIVSMFRNILTLNHFAIKP